MLPELSLRDAALPDLVELLKQQRDVQYDVVVPASKLRSVDGQLVVVGGAARITDDGIDDADAVLVPTDICDDGISDKLGIPRQYLRTLRTSGVVCTLDDSGISPDRHADHGTPLVDANVNAWLQAQPGRMFLIRGFRVDDPDQPGIARAFLSDRYAPIDNYDVLLAALDGIKQAGVKVDVHDGQLTERNMRLAVSAPEITALAPTLLGNYRSPFGPAGGTVQMDDGRVVPTVEAGFEIRNSETGGGAFSIVPRLRIPICRNGMTVTKDALRAVHIGGRLDEGVVRWAADTQKHALTLVRSKVRDAVLTFLDVDYIAKVIAGIEEKSGTPVESAAATIQRVAKIHAFTDTEAASILDCFIKSGDVTAGGVMQAVTAAAQLVPDPDRAAEFEDMALDVLATAAAR